MSRPLLATRSIRNLRLRICAAEMASRNTAPDLPAFLFDVDGTLIDSVYEHVNSWAKALKSAGIVVANWKLHRRIGMSGEAFVHELLRETGRSKLRSGELER